MDGGLQCRMGARQSLPEVAPTGSAPSMDIQVTMLNMLEGNMNKRDVGGVLVSGLHLPATDGSGSALKQQRCHWGAVVLAADKHDALPLPEQVIHARPCGVLVAGVVRRCVDGSSWESFQNLLQKLR